MDPSSPSRHVAARQINLARGGGLVPWFLVECAVPFLCFSVLTVRYLSFALRACSAAGKSLRHESVVPSTRSSSLGRVLRAEARQPKLRKIGSTVARVEQEETEETEVPSPFAPVKCIECAFIFVERPPASTPYRGKRREELPGISWGWRWNAGTMKQEVTEETEKRSP